MYRAWAKSRKWLLSTKGTIASFSQSSYRTKFVAQNPPLFLALEAY